MTIEKLTLKVSTMRCEGCVSGIRKKLQELPDVQSVEGDVQENRITVTLRDGQIGRTEICKSITETGHVCGEQ